MESINTITIKREKADVKIEQDPFKISTSYVGTYKEFGEQAFTTPFTLIKTVDENKHTSWEVILQSEFPEEVSDMINKSILDQVDDLFV